MVQTMETSVVADPAALMKYYGQGFVRSTLPAAGTLETVEKGRIARALSRATRPTQKGAYHKAKHPPHLLAMMDPEQVRGRCPACERLFTAVGSLIRGGLSGKPAIRQPLASNKPSDGTAGDFGAPSPRCRPGTSWGSAAGKLGAGFGRVRTRSDPAPSVRPKCPAASRRRPGPRHGRGCRDRAGSGAEGARGSGASGGGRLRS